MEFSIASLADTLMGAVLKTAGGDIVKAIKNRLVTLLTDKGGPDDAKTAVAILDGEPAPEKRAELVKVLERANAHQDRTLTDLIAQVLDKAGSTSNQGNTTFHGPVNNSGQMAINGPVTNTTTTTTKTINISGNPEKLFVADTQNFDFGRE